jgi:hypothetical protein
MQIFMINQTVLFLRWLGNCEAPADNLLVFWPTRVFQGLYFGSDNGSRGEGAATDQYPQWTLDLGRRPDLNELKTLMIGGSGF